MTFVRFVVNGKFSRDDASMAQAMVGGDLEVADSDVPAMLNAVSAGALDGKLISVYINRFPFAFVVRNEIKTADDLKGKRLAISRFGSSSDVTTRMLLRHFKLDPDKDVKIIQAAGTTRLPAMKSPPQSAKTNLTLCRLRIVSPLQKRHHLAPK